MIRRSSRDEIGVLNHQSQSRASSSEGYRRSRKSEPAASRFDSELENSRKIMNDIYFPSVRDLPYSHFASPSFNLYRRNKPDKECKQTKVNHFDALPDEMVSTKSSIHWNINTGWTGGVD